jgi:hypothetical protein
MCCRGGWWRRKGLGKAFFFEKKKQKTFIYLGRDVGGMSGQREKSFLVLFFKKELLAYLRGRVRGPGITACKQTV